MIQVYFTGLRCDEETDEVGADEPYILVTTVDLGSTVQVAGFPVPIPGYDVYRFGPYSDVDQGDFRAGPGQSQAFWGRTGAPAALTDPDKAIFAIALMENDDGDAENLRGIIKGLVGGSVFGSLDLDRDKKVESLLRDINSGLQTPTGAPNFDDPVGGAQELRFTREELARAESGAQVAKSLVFVGDGGRYTATFEARNPFRDWSGLGDRWRSIGGFFPAGAPIAVTSRRPGNFDLFIVGNDGRVYTSWWYEGHDWSGVNDNWRSIGGFFPPGAPITAIAKSPNSIDLFITGNDGRVYTSWWYEGHDWSGVNDNWRSIGGFFPPGAPVSVTSRNAGNLDVFITGNDGRVYTSWWYQGHDWSGVNDNWRSIGGFFPNGAAVGAIAKSANSIDLFITGNDGRVYTSWWYEGHDWSGVNDNWRSIGGFFPPGAPVSVTSRNAGNLDVFITGNDGRVYTSWWYQGHDWSGVNDNWRNIGGVFPNGAPVSAVARTPEQLDLFITGNDGRVYTSWWHAGGDWSGLNDRWRNIGGVFPAGRKATAIARAAQNLDVFICGGDGRVYTSWWQG